MFLDWLFNIFKKQKNKEAIANQIKQLNQIVDDFPKEAMIYRNINDNEEENIRRSSI